MFIMNMEKQNIVNTFADSIGIMIEKCTAKQIKCRLISLYNTDYKIFTKRISLRCVAVIPEVLNSHQGGIQGACTIQSNMN